jgi:hypothetical protein
MTWLSDVPGLTIAASGIWLFYTLVMSFVRTKNLIFGFYLLAATAMLVTVVGTLGPVLFGAEFVETALNMREWGRISAIALVLSGLTAFIRFVKPPFARFPRVFSAFPLLIIPAHYFGMNSAVLKEWVIGIYEIGALFIALVMYAAQLRRDAQFLIILAGLGFNVIAFTAYWFPELVLVSGPGPWKISFALGCLLIARGIRGTEKHFVSVTSADMYATNND